MKQVMPSAFIARERQSLSFAPVGASEVLEAGLFLAKVPAE